MADNAFTADDLQSQPREMTYAGALSFSTAWTRLLHQELARQSQVG